MKVELIQKPKSKEKNYTYAYALKLGGVFKPVCDDNIRLIFIPELQGALYYETKSKLCEKAILSSWECEKFVKTDEDFVIS